MTYTYSMEENDFLIHQLFLDSMYKNSRKNRLRTSFIFAGLFLLLGFYFYWQQNQKLTIYFLGVGVLSMIIFPLYLQWRYKKHYQKHVKRTFGPSFGKKLFLKFEQNHIDGKDEDGSESKISYSQLDAIHELPEHYFLKLSTGSAIIIPKSQIPNMVQLKADLTHIAQNLAITIQDHTHWKWK